MMKSKPILFLVPLLLFAGCIEFSRQTLSYRYDAAADTLYIFQDYEGILGADDSGRLSTEESEQLASVMKGGRTFFFNNWISEYNRARVEEDLKKPKGELDANEEFETAMRTLEQRALSGIQVENIGFYKNKEGQLCGAQRVTVRQCSKIVAALNRMMPFVMRESAGQNDKSEKERQALLKFAAGNEPFLRFDGNRVEVRTPMDADAFHAFEQGRMAQGIRSGGGSFTFKDDVLTVQLGERDAKTFSITLPFSEKTYVENALAAARQYGIKEGFDPHQAAKEFLAGAGGN
jgi:hypothetical protein